MDCDHPLAERAWRWDGSFYCFKCGKSVQNAAEED